MRETAFHARKRGREAKEDLHRVSPLSAILQSRLNIVGTDILKKVIPSE